MATLPEDLADSTDWLTTPLAGLAPLESSLRCQVCKDFYTTPMMTSCSHTFCSLCIRRYLSQEGRCPACRENDQEIKLRRNWVVEELVTSFKNERAKLLQTAREVADAADKESRPKKRRKVTPDVESMSNGHAGAGENRRSTRSQSRKTAVQAQDHQFLDGSSSAREHDEVMDTDEGSVFEESPARTTDREPSDGLVACPCCGKRMKETVINSHLDNCISGGGSLGSGMNGLGTPSVSHTPSHRTEQTSRIQAKPPKKREHLPFINYSLYNDTKLRRKLVELGIPSNGSKELMRKRHTEWVNLWNANCDSSLPVSKTQLLDELAKWERTMGRQIDQPPSLAGGSVMAKDFNRDEYSRTQQSNFNDLIAMARKSRPTSTGPASSNASTPIAVVDGVDERSSSVEHPVSSPRQGHTEHAPSSSNSNPTPQPHINVDPDLSTAMPNSWLMPMATAAANHTATTPLSAAHAMTASTSTSATADTPFSNHGDPQMSGAIENPPPRALSSAEPGTTSRPAYTKTDSYTSPSEFDDYARPQYRGGKVPHFR